MAPVSERSWRKLFACLFVFHTFLGTRKVRKQLEGARGLLSLVAMSLAVIEVPSTAFPQTDFPPQLMAVSSFLMLRPKTLGSLSILLSLTPASNPSANPVDSYFENTSTIQDQATIITYLDFSHHPLTGLPAVCSL